MKIYVRRHHTTDAFPAMLLFCFFALAVLLLLLFSARVYQVSVAEQQGNNDLYTAQAYITTKFHRHDTAGGIGVADFQGFTALTFSEEENGQAYCTYLYLMDGELRELFTAAGSRADPTMGSVIAELKEFRVEFLEGDFYRIILTDMDGRAASFLLHEGVPSPGNAA